MSIDMILKLFPEAGTSCARSSAALKSSLTARRS
jgi:hypothetical protein